MILALIGPIADHRFKVRDIDQTDYRFEPSSRTLLMDEHSYQ